MKRLAITGGIGCGKSLVGDYLMAQGVPVLDTDHVVHQLMASDPLVKQEILDTFGPGVFNSREFPHALVNRKKLADIVFQTPEKRQQLEAILHPKVRDVIQQFFEDHSTSPVAAVLIPLLYETEQESNYDEVWLVTTTPEQQLARLGTYRKLSSDEAQARIACQMPQEEKMRRTPIHITNDGTKEATERQVLNHLNLLLQGVPTATAN